MKYLSNENNYSFQHLMSQDKLKPELGFIVLFVDGKWIATEMPVDVCKKGAHIAFVESCEYFGGYNFYKTQLGRISVRRDLLITLVVKY